MKVYLAYCITNTKEEFKIFKKEKDAEDYIREKAKKMMVNMTNILKADEGRLLGRLFLDILFKNEEDPEYKVYGRLYVVEKELN